ncbi:MAG: DUF4139 domain-containing protein [Nitrospirae bacterium]|nr:DUF4139 domain-containing protein [Nitrospirota bacterium]
MRERSFYNNILFITLFLALFIAIGSSTAKAIENDPELKTVSTGLDDQVGMSLTVYNVNLGLVKDVRELTLDRVIGNLRFMDVASGIIPTSVSIRSLIDANSLGILEQNYEYDLLNPQKLLDKYVGKKVKIFNENPYTEREEIIEATLLSNNGGAIYQIGDEITFNYPGRVIFPEVPDDLISKPTLVWMFENTLPSKQKVEASYLTNGINWRADYVVTLNDKDDMADLSGWVTIENMSGTTYKDAKLKLVAGDVNRVKDEHEYDERMMYAAKAMAADEQFKEDAFFEYHIYTLQRNSTIKNNQTKQISLITADDIPVKKEFIFQGAAYYYRTQYGQPLSNQKVGVYVEIANMEKNNLGIPLPKGTIRIYKNDNEGSLQFVGEDSIDHTPKDEKIKVKLGDAFDIVGSRKQTSWEKTAYDTYEAGYEISLRNHQKEDIVVKVVEPIQGDWKMVSSSHDYNKTEAFTAEFNIPVPKDKEVKLNYKARMKF